MTTRDVSAWIGKLAVVAATLRSSAQDPCEIVTVHRFHGHDGGKPVSALVESRDGNLYGTTIEGGANNVGTLFMLQRAGGIRVLHSFVGLEGAGPASGVLETEDGVFYGTTQFGGNNEWGTIYRFEATSGLQSIHSFSGTDGGGPEASLRVTGGRQRIYGTTNFGGTYGHGVLFTLEKDVLTVQLNFDCRRFSAPFERGDVSADGRINISDAIAILLLLFAGDAPITCLDAADVDNSGEINIADGIYILTYQFFGGSAPPPPSGGCGMDYLLDGDSLGCESFAGCE